VYGKALRAVSAVYVTKVYGKSNVHYRILVLHLLMLLIY